MILLQANDLPYAIAYLGLAILSLYILYLLILEAVATGIRKSLSEPVRIHNALLRKQLGITFTNLNELEIILKEGYMTEGEYRYYKKKMK